MPYDVLVRAMGGEPKHLVALESEGRLVFVANPQSLERIKQGLTEPVGVPVSDVFEFDAATFAKIVESGDWRIATPVPARL